MEVVGETGAETGAGTGGEALGDAAADALVDAAAAGRRPLVRGHVVALVTVLVWAVTFVSTKVLLVHFAPVEILFFRFMIGFVALAALALPEVWGNLAFLGLGASALCFVTWNVAVRELGPVRTSLYIYLVPALTVLASTAVLGEPLTPLVVLGVLLTIAGLLLSERGK